jgi:uncharacterized metal-binding protein YceD (DUF177 family)
LLKNQSVDYLADFVIPFMGLSLENHTFDFEVNNAFFEHFEYSEIKKGKVSVEVILERQERMLIFGFKIQGSVEVTCDRCLDVFDHPVSGREQLIVKFGHERLEESDDVLMIPHTDYQIDLAPLIYEYINLLLPIRHVHPMNENGEYACDPEVTKFITETPEHENTDPRWEVLKGLTGKEKEEN